MALIVSDGFSLYNSGSTQAIVKGWAGGGSYVTFQQAGRWGAGSYSINVNGNSSFGNPGYITQTLSLSGSTSILGVAIKSSNSQGYKIFTLTNGTATVAVEYTTGGQLKVTNASTTTYYTTTTPLSSGSWYYLEFKVIWSATVGRIVFRIDTAQLYDSGATLNLGSSTNTTTLSLGASNNGSGLNTNFADLLFMDGSGTTFNDFQGDVRIESLLPTADGANSTWSLPNDTILASTNQSRLTTSTAGWAALTGTPTLTRVATGGPDSRFTSYLSIANSSPGNAIITTPNGTSGFAVTPGQTLGFGCWYNTTSSSFPQFTTSVRFYDGSGTQVGSDLSFGNVTATQTWFFANVTTNTVIVPATAATCALIITFSVSSTYWLTGLVLSTTSTTPAYVDPGSSPHYLEVGDLASDSDGTYLKSSALGAKETYVMGDMSGTGTILGVRPLFVARKETSGPQRTVATVTRISGTDYVGSNNMIIPSSLTYVSGSDLYPSSPATGTTWTKTEVNGMEAGYDITQ